MAHLQTSRNSAKNGFILKITDGLSGISRSKCGRSSHSMGARSRDADRRTRTVRGDCDWTGISLASPHAWWLALNNIPSDALLMRADNDNRPDPIVKTNMLNQIQLEWNPIWAFDDNPSTIPVWQKARIPVTVVPGWMTF